MLGALAWTLWPDDWSSKIDAEPLYVFLTTFVIWVSVEATVTGSILRQSSSANDISVAKTIASYHIHQFREFLKDHDHYNGLDPNFLSETSHFHRQVEQKQIFFQDAILQEKLKKFSSKLGEFNQFLALNSTPDKFGSIVLQSIIPPEGKHGGLIGDDWRERTKTAITLADIAWEEFDQLYDAVVKRCPEAFPVSGDRSWLGHYF